MPFFGKNMKSRLRQPFAMVVVVGLVFVALLTFAGGWFSTQVAWNTTVRAEAYRQALRIRRAIFRQLNIAAAFIEPSSPAAAAAFEILKSKEFFRDEEGLVAIHIWDREGKLAWSSREQMMGKGLVNNIPPSARGGEFVHSFRVLDHESLGPGSESAVLLEVIVPLWWGTREPGTLPDLYAEIYVTPDFLVGDFRESSSRIWVVSIALGAAGYLFLIGVVWMMIRQRSRSFEQEGYLSVSRRIAAATASILEPEELFEKIVREIRQAIPCDRCLLASFDPVGRKFSAWRVESDLPLGVYGERLRPEQGELLDEIYLKRAPYRVFSDLRNSGHIRARELWEAGLRSLLIVPVLRDETPIAHIAISRTRLDAFGMEEVNLLLAIAGQIAPALRNAALYHTAETRARRMETLNELTQMVTENMEFSVILDRVAQAAAKLLDADHARVFVLDERHESLVLKAAYGGFPPPLTPEMRLSFGQSVTGWTLREMRPQIIADAQTDPRWEDVSWEWVPREEFRALLVQPVSYPGGVIGSINVMSERPDFFAPEDLTLL